MNWIQQAKESILDRMKPLEAMDCRVEQIPSGRAAPKARLYTYYRESTFADPQLLQTLVQNEEVRFDLILEFRDPRGPDDAYPLLCEVERLITGFQPLGKGKCVWRFVRLEQFEEGSWIYRSTIAFDRERRQQKV